MITSKEYVYDLTLDEALIELDRTLYDRNCDIRVIQARQQLIDVIRIETNKLKQDLEVLEQLKEILSGDFLFRAFDFKTAKRFRDYLKSNDLVKQWLESDKNG